MSKARRGFGSFSVKWDDRKLTENVRREAVLRLKLASEALVSQIRENISISTRAEGPSKPGEMPHADSGNLRKSITYEVDADTLTARIGSTIQDPPYPKFLEVGTSKMKARPYLVRTLREMKPRLRKILGG